MIKQDLIFELYTEEIPASYQERAITDFKKHLIVLLDTYLCNYESIETSGTANRLIVYIQNLEEKQRVVEEEIKGPPKNLCFDSNNKPTAPLIGFSQKVNLPIENIQFKSIKNIEYACANVVNGGNSVVHILNFILEKAITSLSFERTMKWGNGSFVYARPILSYLCIYGKQHLSWKDEDGLLWKEVKAVQTVLDNQISRNKDLCENALGYFSILKNRNIIHSVSDRLTYIKQLLENAALKENLEVVINQSVLKEVNFLVEVPYVIVGEFNANFLRLPDILIITEMEHHQRYFPLKSKNGTLSSKFLFIANLKDTSNITIKNVKEGNEKVLTSRLSDGSFFYDEDRKKPLHSYVDNLKKIVYQEKMGTIFDKKERLKNIAKLFVEMVPNRIHTSVDLNRACDLLKADLTTHLVYEFDELQGSIGSIYASIDKEFPDICIAIQEHYLPRFQGDIYPTNPLGVLCSFIDKFDNIIASFILGKEPTSSQDPLAIRRQSLYAIEILIQNKIHLNLKDFLTKAISYYSSYNITTDIVTKIWDFLRIRLITIFDKQGFDKKLINAGLYTDTEDIYDIYLKLSSLTEIKDNENFSLMMTSFNRMYNILNEYLKQNKDVSIFNNSPDLSLFEKQEEHALFSFSNTLNLLINKEKDTMFYGTLFIEISKAKPIIDNFFNEVMVMCDDTKIRINRLRLLNICIQPITKIFNLDMLK